MDGTDGCRFPIDDLRDDLVNVVINCALLHLEKGKFTTVFLGSEDDYPPQRRSSSLGCGSS